MMQIASLPRYQSTNVGGGLVRRSPAQCDAPRCYRPGAWQVFRNLDDSKPRNACTTHVDEMRKGEI